MQGLSVTFSQASPGNPIPTPEEQPWPLPLPWPRSLLIAPLFSRLVPGSKLHMTSLPTSRESYSPLFLNLSAGALLTGCPHHSGCHAWESRSHCLLSGLACPPWGRAESVPVVSYISQHSFNPTPTNRYCRKCGKNVLLWIKLVTPLLYPSRMTGTLSCPFLLALECSVFLPQP